MSSTVVSSGLASLTKKIPWKRVLEKSTPEGRKTITELLSKNEELCRQIYTEKTSTPQIDFSKYQKVFMGSKYEATFMDLQSKAKASPSSNSQKTTASEKLQELEELRSAKMREATDFLNQLEKDVAALKEQMKKLQSARPVEQMTVQDAYDTFPNLKKQIHTKLANDDWSVVEDETLQDNHKEAKNH